MASSEKNSALRFYTIGGGAVAVAAVLGLLYPLLGASMLVALLVDTLLPGRWRQRFGL